MFPIGDLSSIVTFVHHLCFDFASTRFGENMYDINCIIDLSIFHLLKFFDFILGLTSGNNDLKYGCVPIFKYDLGC